MAIPWIKNIIEMIMTNVMNDFTLKGPVSFDFEHIDNDDTNDDDDKICNDDTNGDDDTLNNEDIKDE